MNESISFVDQLVIEYLAFRGFTESLRAFEYERGKDVSFGLQAKKVVEYLLSFVKSNEIESANKYWNYLDSRFFSRMQPRVDDLTRKLRDAFFRYYLVVCIQNNKNDQVSKFFEIFGDELASLPSWSGWMALPFAKNPESKPPFDVYFARSWQDSFVTSLHNFVTTVFHRVPPPSILKYNVFRLEIERLMEQNHVLLNERASLQDSVEQLQRQLSESQSLVRLDALARSQDHFSEEVEKDVEDLLIARKITSNTKSSRQLVSLGDSEGITGDVQYTTRSVDLPTQLFPLQMQTIHPSNKSSVTRARFSARGDRIASSSADGIVAVWDSSSPKSAAYLSCGLQVTAIDWDLKNNRILAIGTGLRKIRLWNTQSLHVVEDLYTSSRFQRINDLSLSPAEDDLVVSMSSGSNGGIDDGSLCAWNLEKCVIDQVFSLTPAPLSIRSVRYNHNGNMLIAGCSDGMIRVFDVNTSSAIMGWNAHSGPVTCVRYAPHETSLFSVGTDGKMVEWSIHKMGCELNTYEFPHLDEMVYSPASLRSSSASSSVIAYETRTPSTPNQYSSQVDPLTPKHTHISPMKMNTELHRSSAIVSGEEAEDEDDNNMMVLSGNLVRFDGVYSPDADRLDEGISFGDGSDYDASQHSFTGTNDSNDDASDEDESTGSPSSHDRTSRSRHSRPTPRTEPLRSKATTSAVMGSLLPSQVTSRMRSSASSRSSHALNSNLAGLKSPITDDNYSAATSFVNKSLRPEIVVSSDGKFILSSNPHLLYQVDKPNPIQVFEDGYSRSWATTVDWHPSTNSFVTGFSDASVRVTTLCERADIL